MKQSKDLLDQLRTSASSPLEKGTAFEQLVQEWLMKFYRFTTDKDSKITHNPNDWSDDPRYILNSIGKIVQLSIMTMKEVAKLPDLGLDK